MSSPMPARTLRSLALAAVAALAVACATPGAPRTVAIGPEVRLAAGVPVALPDRSTLVYAGLANDSRCPRDVQCIHAGSVEVLFRYDAGSGASAVRIGAPREVAAALGAAWRLELADVAGTTPQAIAVRIRPAP